MWKRCYQNRIVRLFENDWKSCPKRYVGVADWFNVKRGYSKVEHIGIGGTALQRAVEYNQVEVVRYLLSLRDIDVNENNNTSQWTALVGAAIRGHTEIVRLLLEHPDVDVNARARFGQTALIYASTNNHREVVKLLVEDERVNVNDVDDFEEDALMMAAKRNAFEAVELLLQHARIELRNVNGKTALSLATSQKNTRIMKALQAHVGVEFKTEVGQKLKENDLGQYARKFYDAKVETLEIARSLTIRDLSEMMVDRVGDRKRVLRLFGCIDDDERSKEKVDEEVKVVLAERIIEEQSGSKATNGASKKKKKQGKKQKGNNAQVYEALPNAPRTAVVVPVNSDEEEEEKDVPLAKLVED